MLPDRTNSKDDYSRATGRRRLVRNWTFRVLFLTVVAAMLSPLLAARPISYGIWFQSEPVLTGLCAICGVMALTNVTLIWASPRLRGRLGWVQAMPAIAICAWSLVALLFIDFPGRSLLGSVEMKEGIIWYALLAVLIPTIRLLSTIKRCAIALIAIAAILYLGLAVTMALPPTPFTAAYLPLYFADYLGFPGFFIIFAALSVARRIPRALTVTFVAAGVLTVYFSTNSSALGLVGVAAVSFGVGYWACAHLTETSARRIATTVCVVLGVTSTTVIWAYPFDFILIEQKTIEGLYNSLASRHLLINIVSDAITHDPVLLFFGQGFGTYTDSFIAHLPVDWVTLRDDARFWEQDDALAISSGHWDAILRVDFHSHNFLADHLLYAGIVGMVLIITFFIWPIVIVRREDLATTAAGSLAIFLLATVWFMPITIVGGLGLWLGLTPARRIRVPWRPPSAIPRAALSTVGGLLLLMAIWLMEFSDKAYHFGPPMVAPIRLAETPSATGLRQPENCPDSLNDFGSGGVHLAHRLDTMTRAIKSGILNHDVIEEPVREAYQGLICASLETIASGNASLQLKTAFLRTLGDLAFVPRLGEIRTLFTTIRESWPNVVSGFLDAAPRRADLASAYLLYLLAEQDTTTFNAMARQMYDISRETPVAQWFYGIRLLDGTDPDGGIALMRRALEAGVERFLPVDRNLKADILGTGNAAPTPATERLTVIAPSGQQRHIAYVEVAKTKETRTIGLQGRLSLGADSGLLMVYDEPQDISVWMKDTYIPLDVVFIDKTGRITAIEENTLPQSEREIGPVPNTFFVLELPAGTAERTGMQVGDLIRY